MLCDSVRGKGQLQCGKCLQIAARSGLERKKKGLRLDRAAAMGFSSAVNGTTPGHLDHVQHDRNAGHKRRIWRRRGTSLTKPSHHGTSPRRSTAYMTIRRAGRLGTINAYPPTHTPSSNRTKLSQRSDGKKNPTAIIPHATTYIGVILRLRRERERKREQGTHHRSQTTGSRSRARASGKQKRENHKEASRQGQTVVRTSILELQKGGKMLLAEWICSVAGFKQ